MSRIELRRDPPRPSQLPLHRMILARALVEVRRRHIVRWSVAASAAAILTMSVTGAVSSASRTRSQWGETLVVWVATGPLDAGHLISRGDTRALELPIGAVPSDPVTGDPTGSRLRDSLAAGEVVRIGRLAPEGAGPMAARLGPRTRGITLVIGKGSVLAEGDAADLLAMVGGRPVATSARVISAGDGWATFAVADDEVSAVVNELGVGGVIPVLAP